MKNACFLILLFVLSVDLSSFPARAQKPNENSLSNLIVEFGLQRPPSTKKQTALQDSQIKDIQAFGEKSGIAFTSNTLFKTNDNGATWREIALPKSFNQK